MIEPSALADRYVEIWNEPDAAKRRAAIRDLWNGDAVHAMGTLVVVGHDALERRIAASHERNVVQNGFRFRRVGKFEVVRNAVKFGWELTPAGTSDVESTGIGILILSDDGRIDRDYLFVEW